MAMIRQYVTTIPSGTKRGELPSYPLKSRRSLTGVHEQLVRMPEDNIATNKAIMPPKSGAFGQDIEVMKDWIRNDSSQHYDSIVSGQLKAEQAGALLTFSKEIQKQRFSPDRHFLMLHLSTQKTRHLFLQAKYPLQKEALDAHFNTMEQCDKRAEELLSHQNFR